MVDGNFGKYMKAKYFAMQLDRHLSNHLNGCFLFGSEKYMIIVLRMTFKTLKALISEIYNLKTILIRGKSYV